MRHPASITSLLPKVSTSPEHPGAELMAILPRAQLARSYEYQLRQLAGPLYWRVAHVFGGAHAPLYLLTDRIRRSVWNAVLASHYPAGDMAQFRMGLLETKSRTLLEQAYGHLPRGFLSILKKCGEVGLNPDFYLFWHRYLTERPEDFSVVASWDTFDARLTFHMHGLPPALARLPIVGRFHLQEVHRLVETFTWIHEGRPDPALWDNLAIRLIAGENPLNILMKIIDDLTLPQAYITGDNRFRHIGSVRDLKEIGRRFENCLGEPRSLRTALQGLNQYYEYHDGKEVLVVSITADPPFGFNIDDIRLNKNDYPPGEQRDRVMQALTEHGVFERRSIFEVIQSWDSPVLDYDLFPPDD